MKFRVNLVTTKIHVHYIMCYVAQILTGLAIVWSFKLAPESLEHGPIILLWRRALPHLLGL